MSCCAFSLIYQFISLSVFRAGVWDDLRVQAQYPVTESIYFCMFSEHDEIKKNSVAEASRCLSIWLTQFDLETVCRIRDISLIKEKHH